MILLAQINCAFFCIKTACFSNNNNMKNLFKSYKKNINLITNAFNNRDDLILREIKVGNHKFAIFYILGLSDAENISKLVIAPIINHGKYGDNILQTLQDKVLYFSEIETETQLDNIIVAILKGESVIIANDEKEVIILKSDKYKERTIAEPPTSAVIKGPRSGFVENIQTNLSSIKKILKTPDFKTIQLSIGRRTKTMVAITYIDGIADPKVVNEIKKKLEAIDIDGILDTYYITQYLETRKQSMFKQVGITEKPDIACGKLLEGRVAVFVDGSPIVLTLPFIFFEDLQSSNDYYSEKTHVSMVRIVRLCSLLITILLPGLYIAIELHHYKIIPLKYIITILNTTQGLPLTPLLELLFVLLLFEILYEASLRMPRYLGQAMSIVGALILGDTAVKAGIVSPPAVMIIALSSISKYVIPDQSSQMSLIRLIFILSGGLLGFYGMTVMFMFGLFYLSDMDAYGSAYLAPLSPFIRRDMKDFIIKSDLTEMTTRPKSISNKNSRRLKQ